MVQALAAVGGAVWVLGEGRKAQLSYQINISEKLLDRETEDADKHYRLLDYVVASTAASSSRRSVPAQAEADGRNPTRQLLVIHPLGHDNQVEGLLEIFPACRHAAGDAARLSAIRQADVRPGDRVVQTASSATSATAARCGPRPINFHGKCTKASTFAKRATPSSTKGAGCSVAIA